MLAAKQKKNQISSCKRKSTSPICVLVMILNDLFDCLLQVNWTLSPFSPEQNAPYIMLYNHKLQIFTMIYGCYVLDIYMYIPKIVWMQLERSWICYCEPGPFLQIRLLADLNNDMSLLNEMHVCFWEKIQYKQIIAVLGGILIAPQQSEAAFCWKRWWLWLALQAWETNRSQVLALHRVKRVR